MIGLFVALVLAVQHSIQSRYASFLEMTSSGSWSRMALIVNVTVVQLEGHSLECTDNRQHGNHMWVRQAVDP